MSSFIPNRPGRFEAVFIRFEIGESESGSCPIAVCEIDGQERSVWLWSTALRSRVKKLRPNPDERLVFEFAGEKRSSANGRSYWPDSVSAPDRPAEEITVDSPLFTDEEVDDHGTVIGY